MTRRKTRTLVHFSALAAAGCTPALLAQTGDPYAGYRNRTQVTLPGTIRDFVPFDQGGHPDFKRLANAGVGRYVYVSDPTLSTELVPVVVTSGSKVRTNWTDARTRPIIPTKSYIDPRAGDAAGSVFSTSGGTASTAANYSQWFRTIDGVNTASFHPTTLQFDSSTQAYVFQGTLDGYTGGAPDYTYSYAMDIPFVYERGQDWYLTVRTNADAWVYINNKLVIDNAGGLGRRPAIVVQNSLSLDNSTAISVPGGMISVSTNSTSGGAVSVQNSGQIGGDVLVGPGGDPRSGIVTARPDAITGITGSLGEPMAVDIVQVPTGMPPSVGNLSILNEVRTLSGDIHANTIRISGNGIVRIAGPTRILCDANFLVETGSQILLDPGARLELYCRGSITLRNTALINVAPSSGDPDRVILACEGNISVEQSVQVVGHLVAPRGTVSLYNSCTLIGTITANSASLRNTSGLIAMGSFGQSFGGVTMAGSQRIDLDRLAWLTENRTHRLRVFFANRLGQASNLRIESNCTLLNLAAMPRWHEND
jgi:fibro-slime domain-containing protein